MLLAGGQTKRGNGLSQVAHSTINKHYYYHYYCHYYHYYYYHYCHHYYCHYFYYHQQTHDSAGHEARPRHDATRHLPAPAAALPSPLALGTPRPRLLVAASLPLLIGSGTSKVQPTRADQ